jgi:hypothetical protein
VFSYCTLQLLYLALCRRLITTTNTEDFLDDLLSPVPDIIESEIILCLAVNIQMGHDIHENFKAWWSTTEYYFLLFVAEQQNMTFLHIPTFIHFSNNDSALDNNDLNCDRPWNLRHIFSLLNCTCSEYYAPL